MTDLQNNLARLEEANRRMAGETERLLAEMKADKAKHNGLSFSQRSPRRSDRFANANPNGGGL